MTAPSDSTPNRTDLFVTTALSHAPHLVAQAHAFARELHVAYVPRRDLALPHVFEQVPGAGRALVVQTDRLLLTERTGETLFYHPNMAFPRLGNLTQGSPDHLINATGVRPGDSVLDCTLGYASEAILCAHVVGDGGEVHGIEAVPELGIVVREGLKTVVTDRDLVNEAMRRIRVIHIGHHLEYLRACPDRRYDIVCFDPFFPEVLQNSETFDGLRAFGDHGPLLPEALAHACRVARRRVVVKAVRWADTLADLGITERVGSRGGKVIYGVIRIGDC